MPFFKSLTLLLAMIRPRHFKDKLHGMGSKELNSILTQLHTVRF